MCPEDLVACMLPMMDQKQSQRKQFFFFCGLHWYPRLDLFFLSAAPAITSHTQSTMKSREYVTSDIESSDDEGGIKNLYVF